jgi:hypothetical protein
VQILVLERVSGSTGLTNLVNSSRRRRKEIIPVAISTYSQKSVVTISTQNESADC